MSKRNKSNKSSIQNVIVVVVLALIVFAILDMNIEEVFTQIANGLLLVGAILLGIYILMNIVDYFFTKAKKNL